MQQSSSYLTFGVNSCLYGINSDYLEEVLPLPELILLPEADCGIVGIFNLRGKMLPVLDLNNRLGYPTADYHLSDSLIVVKCSQLRLGIIINNFSDIRTISSKEIVKSSSIQVGDGELEPLILDRSDVINGMLIGEDKIWILNNLEDWISAPKIAIILDSLNKQEEEDNLLLDDSLLLRDKQLIFCPTATNTERATFRSRAERLKTAPEEEEVVELEPIVVFALGDHLWGIDLDTVQEFVDIKKITPVPCCPPHIIGNANLRGEILTIVDIRKSLSIPILEISAPCKVAVVRCEDMVVGIMVDSIRDAMFLMNSQNLVSATTTLPDVEKGYLQGMTSYGEPNPQLIGILNLSKLLLEGGLVIDQLV